MNPKKILKKILEGNKNICFEEMVALIQSYEFYLSRTSGSHHIFVNHEFDEIINLQKVKGKGNHIRLTNF